MKVRNSKKYPEISYHCMDALNLNYTDECVDVIIDKGTLDAIFTNQNWFEKVTLYLT
jgi:hypothetical protein